MIAKMKHLKKLHLSHAMLNSDVATTIAKTCSKLEYLSLDNCKHIFDNCLENISNSLHETLTYLSIGKFSTFNFLLELNLSPYPYGSIPLQSNFLLKTLMIVFYSHFTERG